MKVDLEHFPTNETGKRMLMQVSPIYDQSYVGKWIFEVIGMEMEEAESLFEELRLQAFPEQATWGIEYWEERYGIEPDERLDLETRRRNINIQRNTKAPMNPARMERVISELTGRAVKITESTAPYTFSVTLSDGKNIVDYNNVHSRLKKIKPSHQNYSLISTAEPAEFYNSGVSSLDSLRIPATHSIFTFHNFESSVCMDGEAHMDGLILMNQRGISGFAFKSSTYICKLYNSEIVKTKSRFLQPWWETLSASQLKKQNVFYKTENKVEMRSYRTNFVSSVANKNSFSAQTLTRNSMWRFDGVRKMNGIKKFNADITTEEVS